MANNGLRTQYPYNGMDPALSPRPLYDYPSPTSNYGANSVYIGGASPGFDNMAYQNTPRYGSSAFVPPPDIFLEGRKGLAQEPNIDSPRGLRKRNSEVMNSDPVSIHLLVETAMGDSQNYEILSFEEVEALKKEQKELSSKLVATRQKLILESKVRDAAKSLTRLASKKEKGHSRKFSSRGNNTVNNNRSSTSAKSEEELLASVKKCEDLARELFEMETRARTIQNQLLMHTAGILQMTHEGPKKRKSRSSEMPNGVGQRPDSPASIYTYETSRQRGNVEDGFDERSLYRSPENLDGLMNALKNGTHHNSQDTLQQNQALSSMEKRLEDLNSRLRELIVQANPERNGGYNPIPKSNGDMSDISTVEQQLDYLDQGLRDISAEQGSRSSLNAVEGRLEGINNQLYAMLSRVPNQNGEKQLPPPPLADGISEEQLDYMEDSFYSVEQLQYSMSQELEELRTQSAKNQESQYETTLMGLWQIILAGEEEARQRKAERRKMLQTDPHADISDMSDDEPSDPNEEFSLSAFSAKVQWLYSRASTLKEKESILRRQIKQQRELNSRSDAQKETEFEKLRGEASQARTEKAAVEEELDRAIRQLTEFDQERIDADSQALIDSSVKVEAAEARANEATATLQAKEKELEELEGEVVRLTTELTFAKAELDSAYGTRAERAAENAPSKKELEDLQTEVENLRKAEASARESERNLKQELGALLSEHETLTKDSIQNEKDRDQFEAAIDKLRDEKEGLEMELSDERVKWLGVRSPGGPSAGQTTMEQTSIRMLREDFRKMMRDRTAEGLKALRHEQEERRKLEALVRSLKKDAIPPKSNLSKTVVA